MFSEKLLNLKAFTEHKADKPSYYAVVSQLIHFYPLNVLLCLAAILNQGIFLMGLADAFIYLFFNIVASLSFVFHTTFFEKKKNVLY